MRDEHDGTPESGRLDRTTMETLARRSETHPLVASWAFTPDRLSPRSLEITLDASAYPPYVDAVRLDIYWFVTGDYYVHYVEAHTDTRYQCRWDRHPKTDAPRTHFHPPPDAGEAESSPVGTHHIDVLFEVLDWVSEHISALHDT
jgi:hypothetical protein